MNAPRNSKRSAAVVGVAVMGSRLMGLVREQIFAFMFGASVFADAFVAAFRIPNLLRDLFAEGALSTAFTTTFTKLWTKEGATRLVAAGAARPLDPHPRPRRDLPDRHRRQPLGRHRHQRRLRKHPREIRAHRPAHPRPLPVHPLRLHRRGGHGHAQCAEYLRHPGQRQHRLQRRLHHRRRGSRLPLRAAGALAPSPFRRAGRLRLVPRRPPRRAGPARHPAPRALAARLPLPLAVRLPGPRPCGPSSSS